MHAIATRLSERAAAAGLALDDQLSDRLLAYYDLLLRWNAKINLTALTDLDEGIDRLLLEPIAAARFLSATPGGLIDLGSGGGSPAIPLALALGAPRLVMVESKARKASFLREAARTVALPAEVEGTRFEALAAGGQHRGAFDLLAMRAVRMDVDALTAAATFLRAGGQIGLFVATDTTLALPPGARHDGRFTLVGRAELIRLRVDVPRETLQRA